MSEPIKSNKHAAWRLNFQFIELFGYFDWPDSEIGYARSIWYLWARRIEAGHEEEENILRKRQQEWEEKEHTASELAYMDYGGDCPGDEYSELCDLRVSMYAALIISLWARVEAYLKELMLECFDALEKKETVLQTVSQFYNETVSIEIDKHKLKASIEKSKELQKYIPYQFDNTKTYFKKNLNIKLQDFSSYKTVNAIRILNNSFKHNNGKYTPRDNKLDTQIDQTMLTTWDMVKENDEIDYSKLPVKELVLACSTFRKELIEKIKKELVNRTEGFTKEASV